MTTTQGEWIAYENGHIFGDGRLIAHSGYTAYNEKYANAQLIALAGNLAQKYDLSKLEAAVEQLRKAWENLSPENLAIAVDGFLASITRQPAGEKTQP